MRPLISQSVLETEVGRVGLERTACDYEKYGPRTMRAQMTRFIAVRVLTTLGLSCEPSTNRSTAEAAAPRHPGVRSIVSV